MKTALTMLAVGASLGLAGCGTAPTQACVTSFSLGAEPQSESGSSMGLANHALPAPGNQQQFIAFTGQVVVSGQCASTNVLASVRPQWSTSDAIDVSISSANDGTNGLATCTGATLSPAVITATYTQGTTTKTAISTLTCQ